VENGTEVLEKLDAALRAARGRVKGIQKELTSAGDPDAPRAYANLLLARLREVPPGVGSVTLKGFSNEEVTVTLDPALSPQENARAYYAEAARRERARARLPALLSRAEKALEMLEALKHGLMDGTVTPDDAASRIPSGGRPTSAGPRQVERAPFRTFFTSGGLEVRVGRSSKDNDTLTFRHSHPQDVWLHARDRGGAHVILRWRKDDPPPQRDLGEAAILAALNSGARTSGTVPVDWTRRKYVRKPRKAPPGTVIPDRVQTLFVEPDPELPERLRRRKEEEEEKERA
jgi:predicted ribosome quality control (RQC) complex YloA/Tae2 family protein